MAGLAAARALAEAGQRVVLLEASSRVGGRIFTVRAPETNLPIELGAEFVHGRPPELLELIDEAGLTLFEREGEFLCFDEKAKPCECEFEGAFQVLDDMPASPDMTFSEFLAGKTLPEAMARRVTGYVEGFNAADARLIGTAALHKQQQAEESIEGGRSYRIREGYDMLPAYLAERFLAAGGSLFRDTVVTRIEWKPSEVRIETGNSAIPEVLAARTVVALPLGVLQSGAVKISPAPPMQSAIDKLAMGTASRITLLFRERFWEQSVPNLSFLFAQQQALPTWWTAAPDTSPVLTGWIGGPRVQSAPTGSALNDQALDVLGRIFSRKDLAEMLVSFHTRDWQADPFTRGSYSYAPKGALLASDELAAPVEGTLYFAGEHTDTTGHWGTVHAALRSGLRAAAQILAE